MTRMFAKIGICAMVAFAVIGCATGGGMSDEEMIRVTAGKVKTALEGRDLDLLMATFSEDFYHPEVGGKEEGRMMLEMAIDAGYADDGEVSLEDMQITINDDGTASVYPVDLSGPPGAISVELIMTKEGAGWLITALNADGV
jgi:hypothetical protein